MLPDVPVEEITLDDLIELVENRVCEGQRLEFKQEPYGILQDEGWHLQIEHKREMLKDITGMANADGGYVVIGIREDQYGRAEALRYVNDPYNVVKSMRDVCNQGVQDPVEGLQIRVIERMQGSQGVIVVYVPPSKLKPHMIILRGVEGFYLRIDNAVPPMTLRQIEAAVLRSPRNVELLKNAGVALNIQAGEPQPTFEAPPYVQVVVSNPAARFFSRFMRQDITPQKLVIVSPYISEFEGYPVGLSEVLRKCKQDGIRIHIVTQQPTAEYHIRAIGALLREEVVDVRYINDLHAKLYVAWAREAEQSFALIGSANFTAQGMYHNLELGMMVYGWDHGKDIVEELYRWGGVKLRTMSKALRA